MKFQKDLCANIEADLFTFDNRNYLSTANYMSNCCVIDHLLSTLANTVWLDVSTLKTLLVATTLFSMMGDILRGTEFMGIRREYNG